jgi:riboflavin synthase alpha subunit
MESDVVLPSLDKFQTKEFAIGIELGDESVVVGGLRLAVYARDEIVFLERIVDETVRRLQLSDRDLGVERAGDHK